VRVFSSLSFWIRTRLSNLINDFLTIVAVPLCLAILLGLEVIVTHSLPFLPPIPYFYFIFILICFLSFIKWYSELGSIGTGFFFFLSFLFQFQNPFHFHIILEIYSFQFPILFLFLFVFYPSSVLLT